jgi:Na+/H+ antiporter NhaC
MKNDNSTSIQPKPNIWALSPLVVFLCLYLVTSLIINDFYKVPITVAFLVSSVYAVCITKGLSINERILQFSEGAANKNIMLMIWIFILAGAFAQSAKDIGSIEATVNLTLQLLPGNLLLAGFFIAACFISLSIGTSVGTIVALMPVVAGISDKTGIDMAFMTGIVVGGAFFGDNLSFISDTTIAATRTQGCAMRDKFRANFQIVLPAALLVLGIYVYKGLDVSVTQDLQPVEWIKVIPYLIVLGTAFMGLNVALVLILGILSTGIVGMTTAQTNFFDWFNSMGNGIMGMGELIIVTL